MTPRRRREAKFIDFVVFYLHLNRIREPKNFKIMCLLSFGRNYRAQSSKIICFTYIWTESGGPKL